MEFQFPLAFVCLPVLALLSWLEWRGRFREAGSVRFTGLGALASSVPSLRTLVAASLPWLRLGGMCLLVVALARPQHPAGTEQDTAEGVDIMLTMDISGSMRAEDFGDKDRFTVAKEILAQFAAQTVNDRLGLVIFASQAFTQCPLTLDHDMVGALVQQVQQGVIKDGTAIGMAIATAAHRLQNSQAKSRVIVLMTDGQNNTGRIDPITAAKAAAALGIRIHTVGVGKEGGAPIPLDDGRFGKQYMTNPDGTLQLTKVDEETLKKVAALTGGKYFRATDPDTLARIYRDIRSMEKSRFKIAARRPVVEDFAPFLRWGALLLLAQFVLGATYARRTP